MKFLIDIPTPIRDSAGVEYEPTGEFRNPRHSEMFICAGDVHQQKTGIIGDYIILRPLWTWPAWLGGWGFTLNRGGDNVTWHATPSAIESCYWRCTGKTVGLDWLQALCPTFTPPTITDWTQPVLNPNYKEPTT